MDCTPERRQPQHEEQPSPEPASPPAAPAAAAAEAEGGDVGRRQQGETQNSGKPPNRLIAQTYAKLLPRLIVAHVTFCPIL